ncbi:MAG: uridine diphosphate-N-acetylglucosamine-binding protein YvcK [Erysipelotrichaceae bacterium]|nr:uridine diphosphate-N-acetylglucosamine-binding protein YvcK [Erysipelotrichaceae bacterium]MDY6035472.1 uridine diphosphate-N-acetylglucosamine-binding protein YvcK [Bulleidia sp.]
MTKRKVVVIGGGHGQSLICRGLKTIKDIDLKAIVTVADDGGSTGRLRKNFHIPAMGDIRNVMISMAESENMLSSLMDYRFDDPDGKEDDILGHNLGNLILTALTQQTGSFMTAIQEVSHILNVKGTIIPASTDVITLYARMEDGVIVRGEANIPSHDHHITQVFYQESVHACKEAVEAIEQADIVIYGIGSVYTSILPNIIIPEIQEALCSTHAKHIYFCNAMSQPGETDGYSVEDHVDALLYHHAPVDKVIVADNKIPDKILQRYIEHGSAQVLLKNDTHSYQIEQRDLLNFRNGFIHHNPQKIKNVIEELMEGL